MAVVSREEVLPRLREAAGHSVLVVGDVVLDRYVIGKATRLSREAPVPVLVHEESFSLPGSAANPALNIRALHSRALQAAVIGDDDAGRELLRLLEAAGVEAGSVLPVPGRRTTVKQRILARASLLHPQQMARVDFLEPRPVPPAVLDRLADEVRARARKQKPSSSLTIKVAPWERRCWQPARRPEPTTACPYAWTPRRTSGAIGAPRW